MKARDFEFDSLRLSDFGFQICRFDSGGVETIDGAEITFNTVTTQHGMTHHITSVEYDYLTFTLQICKNLCDDSNEVIDLETQRNIMRWLCRCEYHKFKLIGDDEYSNIYFMCTFNVNKIEIDGRVVGFELEALTNSPFAHQNPVTIKFDAEAGMVKDIYNKSENEGYIYPDNMAITVKEAGDLEIHNSFENRTTVVKNCESGETIMFNYPIITSSISSHKITNDFNWEFFRLASTFRNRLNTITASLPCSIKITYSPIVKVGI